MSNFLFRWLQWLAMAVILTGLCSCVRLIETGPPPASMVVFELNGPYDGDIPNEKVVALKKAGVTAHWAVPYLFLHTAMYFQSRGDEDRSLHFFDRAIRECQKQKNDAGEGTALGGKINALIRFGRFEKARAALEEQEKKWSVSPFNTFIFNYYGFYYLKQGHYAEARAYYARALQSSGAQAPSADWLALRRDAELGMGLALLLGDYFPAVSVRLGRLSINEDDSRSFQQEKDGALSHLLKASVLNGEIRKTKMIDYLPDLVSWPMACDLENYIGLAYVRAGQPTLALKHLETARLIAQQNNYPLGEADSLFFLNHVYLTERNRAEGIKAAQVLAVFAERYQLVSYMIWAQLTEAAHHHEAGNAAGEVIALEKGLDLWEENAAWLSRNSDFRGIRHLGRSPLYGELIDLYAAQGDSAATFRTAERAKAAGIVDRLTSDSGFDADDLPEFLKQWRKHIETLEADYRTLAAPETSENLMTQTVKNIRRTREAWLSLFDSIRLLDDRFYALVRVSPVSVGDVQRCIDDNTTVFAYYVGERFLYVWVISKSKIRQEKINLFRQEVDRLVDAYLAALKSRDKSRADEQAERVYNTFLKPVIPYVHGDRIVFVPHGSLYNLPFSAMRYVQSYFVDGFAISQLPYGAWIKMISVKMPPEDIKKTVVIADKHCRKARLEGGGTIIEAEELRKVSAQVRVISNDQAGTALAELSGNYGLIQAVGTGCSSDKQQGVFPSISGWQAEPCSYWSLSKMLRLRIRAMTTFWSICWPFGLKAGRAEETMAEQTVWLYAVSPSIIVQLWYVDDKPKTTFLGIFYKNWLKNKNSADALRAAQNTMLQNGYGPWIWAAFVATGK